MNSVNLIGRLTRDPEVRYTSGDEPKAVARFSIAVNDGYGEKQRTSYINIVAWGKTAENCERFLTKGKQVGIAGRIQTGSYEKDGRTIYTTDIVASSVEFIGGNSGGSEQKSDDIPTGFNAVDEDIPF